MTKTEAQKVDNANNISSSRKRLYKQNNDDEMVKNEEVGENDGNLKDDEPTTSKIPSTRPPRRKKRKRNSEHHNSSDSKKPLAGMTISVSTLSDNTKTKNTSSPDHNDTEAASYSYNEVCRSCRELGADMSNLVCKRVNILVCSEAAVRQATQRVRKAIKRNKPLVSVAWLEQCRKQGRKVDFDEYRLDKKAKMTFRTGRIACLVQKII